jgi:hypothetical protein
VRRQRDGANESEYDNGTHRGILRADTTAWPSHETGDQETRRSEEVFLELS